MIVEILKNKGIDFEKTNDPNEIKIKCTSGEHEDRTPSLYYNLQKDKFQCWSCGFKGGSLQFLKSIGIDTPLNTAVNDIGVKKNLLQQRISKLLNNSTNLTLPEDKIPYAGSYRMLSQQEVIREQCFMTNSYGLSGYLCFPIFEFGKLRFIEARVLNEAEGKSKWTRYPSGIDMSNTLYPLDKFKKNGTVILVEGLLDCLYLRSLGYLNTLCIFGTNGFTFTKGEMLKNYGVVNVIPLMDGDRAGQAAVERIAILCQRLKLNCQRVQLDLDKDPKEYTLKELKSMIGEPSK